jgi:hypothetical protein
MGVTPWKALFMSSLILTAAGCGLLTWGLSQRVGWPLSGTGAFVVVIGTLLARMNYRAYRHAVLPGPSTTFPIVFVTACAILWTALVAGLL